MIGLGSNRLTVCRRGGMAITQAGRGGMEWLAGGRLPSWASPYSAAATAALKAAFTAAQWQTIRDYGFAHPALVPFINEDPMLVMSLIEGLGIRKATIRNRSISSSVKDNAIIMPFKFSEVVSMDIEICSAVSNGMIMTGCTNPEEYASSYVGYYSYGGWNGLGISITRQGTAVDNVLSPLVLTFAQNTVENYVRIGGYSNTYWNYDLTIKYWNVIGKNNNLLCKLIPTKQNGEVCFLDTEHLTLYKNVHTDPFTISETPAS